LHVDGFEYDLPDAVEEDPGTEGERVRCTACGAEFDLSDLLIEGELPLFQVTYRVVIEYTVEIGAPTLDAASEESSRTYDAVDFTDYGLVGSHDEKWEPLNEGAKHLLALGKKGGRGSTP